MNLYSVVMLSIDGTLTASANTKKLLNRLERRGIPIILCSARSPGYVKDAARECNLHSPLVCYSGGLILDEQDTILEDTGIPADTALAFSRFAADTSPHLSVTSWFYDVWLADDAQDPYVRAGAERYGREPVEGALEDALRDRRHVHKLLCVGPPMELRELWDRAAPLFPTLTPFPAVGSGLELLSADSSECTAMERLQQYYQVTAKQVVVIGDCLADAGLLRRAGLGIAADNAPEAVRQAAARITAAGKEDGVYIALKNLRFRPRPAGET